MAPEYASRFTEPTFSVEARVVRSFAESVDRLAIAPEEVMGRTLTIGAASYFPERLFLCTPESRYKTRRSGVDSIQVMEDDLFSDPQTHLTDRVVTGEVYRSPVPGEVAFYGVSAQWMLTQIPPESYDTALMFRIPDMAEQLADGKLLPRLTDVLAPGAMFLGSGSFRSPGHAAGLLAPYLTVVRTVELRNPDATHFPFYPANVGFVAVKPR